ncbi:RDD family protein [Cryptosporangium arvum]|uniref:RDD family protein n=1 Tax=Cryptosporangium arvum TaxID=80871 RepID=UPI0004B3961A|nr:RDD family protein [Cryptosporangium arvum]
MTQPSQDIRPDDSGEWVEVHSQGTRAGRPAALVRRGGARVVDVAVCAATASALPWWAAALVAVAWLVVPVWLAGATAGKWLFGIRVTRYDGARLTIGRALAREAFVVGSFVITLVAVLNTMVMVNDPRRQGFQDRIADTVVVDAKTTGRAPAPPR